MTEVCHIVSLGDSLLYGASLESRTSTAQWSKKPWPQVFVKSVQLQRLAQSGGARPPGVRLASGEVPALRPTIIEQSDGFT
jgi:hypothetical protein